MILSLTLQLNLSPLGTCTCLAYSGILSSMRLKKLTRLFLLGASIVVGHAPFAAEPQDFTAASSWEEVQQRQRLLPTDDIWWTVTGEQMAWMHKNVHQLFPTVNVYRSGQVR